MTLSLADQALGRREASWYFGKVMWIRGAAATPLYREGFYRLIHDPVRNAHDFVWLSDEMPKGEPVYIVDGTTTDHHAVPSTVMPALWEWLLWPAIYLAIVALGFSNTSDPAAGIFCTLIFWPVACQPLWVWFSNVEPVRARKIGYGILAVTTVNNYRNRNSR